MRVRNMETCTREDCLLIQHQPISVGIQLYKGTVPCATQIILQGNVLNDTTTERMLSLDLLQGFVTVSLVTTSNAQTMAAKFKFPYIFCIL